VRFCSIITKGEKEKEKRRGKRRRKCMKMYCHECINNLFKRESYVTYKIMGDKVKGGKKKSIKFLFYSAPSSLSSLRTYLKGMESCKMTKFPRPPKEAGLTAEMVKVVGSSGKPTPVWLS
jgi:hypothetical protein